MAAPRTLLVATLAVVAAAFQPLAPVALTGMLLCSDCVRRCTPRKTRLSALTGCVLNFTALAGEAIVIVGDLPDLAGQGGRCAQGRPGDHPPPPSLLPPLPHVHLPLQLGVLPS